ncbi:MAG TPA: hypothetical protein VG845_15015 [Dehalococcoidia bacterium]|jgi:hypothetical protein|nr:hypothetical protein [Dehalococcoidia bacterium]
MWVAIVAVLGAAAGVIAALLLSLLRSAASDSASVNEEYQEYMRSKEQALQDGAKENRAPADDFPSSQEAPPA